jgi:hypothetical protein
MANKIFRKRVLIPAVATVAVLGAGGVAYASTASGDELEGDNLERATAAALEEVGEGEVTETEVGDEEGAYEVEVTKDDGTQVDVHLDENFVVIGVEGDGRGEDDADEDEDEDEDEGNDDGDDAGR